MRGNTCCGVSEIGLLVSGNIRDHRVHVRAGHGQVDRVGGGDAGEDGAEVVGVVVRCGKVGGEPP